MTFSLVTFSLVTFSQDRFSNPYGLQTFTNTKTHTVYQRPAFISRKSGDQSVEMSCRHSITNYDVFLWYKQGRHGVLQHLGYLDQMFPKPEENLEGKIHISGDGRQYSNLSISHLVLEDSGVYYCVSPTVLSNQTWSVQFQLSAPKLVPKASRVDLHCSHDDGSQDIMLWYHQGKGSRLIGLIGSSYIGNKPVYRRQDDRFKITREEVQSGSLSILRVKLSDAGVYFCGTSTQPTAASEVHFDRGTKLKVLEPGHLVKPPAVTLLPPSPEECPNRPDEEKRKKTLVCAVTGFFPDQVVVSWQVDGSPVTDGVATDGDALQDGTFYKMSSRLRVEADAWFTPGRTFTCIGSFFNGNRTSFHSDSVYGTEDTVTREEYLRTSQRAKLSYTVLLVKSSIYTAFVVLLLWKPQGWTTTKQSTSQLTPGRHNGGPCV
uniref:M1-specific T cell receptor beta chain-like n=1 Tax=Doryrhamphus excisus TaxID=161450 RepID=UPI0025AE60C2|nr:M1-specific T cell receptor beta chain-like [Doryrhamphus excisus]